MVPSVNMTMTVTFKLFFGLRCGQNLSFLSDFAFLETVAMCKGLLRTFDLSDCSGICECEESNILSFISITQFLHSEYLTLKKYCVEKIPQIKFNSEKK